MSASVQRAKGALLLAARLLAARGTPATAPACNRSSAAASPLAWRGLSSGGGAFSGVSSGTCCSTSCGGGAWAGQAARLWWRQQQGTASRTPAAGQPWRRTCSAAAAAAPSAAAARAGPRLPPRRPPPLLGGARRRFSSEPQPAAGGSSGSSSSGGSASGGKSPISFNSMLLGVGAFLAVVAIAQHKAQERVDNMMRRSQQVAGKAAVGGPFALTDQDGKPFTHLDLLGKWSVLYFGFTHCPDICPDEMEKLAEAVDLVEKDFGERVQLVFITVDPQRDTKEKVKAYVREFHPRMIGLTGSEEAIKAVSKAYRVYFHKTTDDPDDYLVDHSIITYLMDPKGEFVTFYGKNFDAGGLAASIGSHVKAWRGEGQEGGGGGGPKGAPAGSQEGRAQR